MDEKIKKAYELYLELPTADMYTQLKNELYQNRWCVITGNCIVLPNPHRHYTLLEFAFQCGKDETLFERFMTIS